MSQPRSAFLENVIEVLATTFLENDTEYARYLVDLEWDTGYLESSAYGCDAVAVAEQIAERYGYA